MYYLHLTCTVSYSIFVPLQYIVTIESDLPCDSTKLISFVIVLIVIVVIIVNLII